MTRSALVLVLVWWPPAYAQEPAVPLVEPAAVAPTGIAAAAGAAPAEPVDVPPPHPSYASSDDAGGGASAPSGGAGDVALGVGGPVGAAAFASMLASRALAGGWRAKEREWLVPAAAWAGAAVALAIVAPPVGVAAWAVLAVKAGAAALAAIYGHRVTRKRDRRAEE